MSLQPAGDHPADARYSHFASEPTLIVQSKRQKIPTGSNGSEELGIEDGRMAVDTHHHGRLHHWQWLTPCYVARSFPYRILLRSVLAAGSSFLPGGDSTTGAEEIVSWDLIKTYMYFPVCVAFHRATIP